MRHKYFIFIIISIIPALTGCQSDSVSGVIVVSPAPTPTPTLSPSPPPAPPSFSVDTASVQVAPSVSRAFHASGGTGPYSWSVTSGSGTLSASSGATVTYSSATSQNAKVTVTDSAGSSKDISIRVSEPVTQVAHGGWDGCALLDTGGVKCWGFSDGRLGDGTTTSQSSPVTVIGLESGVTSVAWGYGSGCAIMSDKTVKCWGMALWGTVGIPNPQFTNTSPTTVSGLSDIAELVIGGYHACARDNSGVVYCWGLNTHGQIGDGSKNQRNTPYTVPLNSAAIAIAAGTNHTCAVLQDHTAECWGDDALGQLGDGNFTDQTSPVVVTGLSGVSKMAIGEFHTCALLQNGTVSCWGRGDLGQLGNNSLNNSQSPAAVIGLSNVTAIAAAGSNTCALTASHLYCWGDNQSGAPGSGAFISANAPFTTPQTVTNISTGITSIAIGPSNWGSTVAAVVNGQVFTWGLNDNGQLGISSTGGSQNQPELTSPF